MKKVRSTFTDVLSDGQAAWDQSQNADPARRRTVAEDIRDGTRGQEFHGSKYERRGSGWYGDNLQLIADAVTLAGNRPVACFVHASLETLSSTSNRAGLAPP